MVAPRVQAALKAGGEKHGRKRIARLMRAAGLVGASRRRCGVTTTRRDKEARPAPDLVDRNFVASRPNQLWVADITFVSTLRFQASSTMARYRKPLAVDTKVMSATQSWFGREATKFRSTRSGAGLASLSRRVVVTPERRRLAPTSPAARISRAMRLRPCFSPPALSAACTRGAPYV